MEVKRLVLIKQLNYLLDDSCSKSLMAYQLGMYFICQLSRQNLNYEYIQWDYESLEELSEYFADFLERDRVSHSSLHDALNILSKTDFIYYVMVPPSAEDVRRGYKDKEHWRICMK